MPTQEKPTTNEQIIADLEVLEEKQAKRKMMVCELLKALDSVEQVHAAYRDDKSSTGLDIRMKLLDAATEIRCAAMHII